VLGHYLQARYCKHFWGATDRKWPQSVTMVVGLVHNSEIGMHTRDRMTLLEAVAVVRVLQTPYVVHEYFY